MGSKENMLGPPRQGRDRYNCYAMLKDFKAFVMRGNVLDLAVAVVVGGAFNKIVTSFVDDVLMRSIIRS